MTRLQRRNYTRWVRMVKKLDTRRLCNVFYKVFNTGRTPGVKKDKR